ncbi:MFS transporter [Microbacterium sp. NPDC056234]|uniref:MFS transporter n=1 Tax=Microbacterium sp. NPDC056234 TaxID=3345757 RepID=UPI0035DB2AD4
MTVNTSPAPTRSSLHRWWAMLPLLLGILIGALAISSVATALPAIRSELHFSDTEVLWLVDIYSLTLAATLILAARIGDAFGRKRIVLIGLAGFAVLNAIGGVATSGLVLIIVRALLGTAEAFVIAGVVATIGAHYQARQRVLAYGLWTATFGAGSALGPVVGGLLADGPGWRWLLLGAVPLAVLAVVLTVWLVPDSRAARSQAWDVPSIVMSIVALGALVYALHEALASPLVAGAVGVVAVIGLIFFVTRQRRLADPLIDVGLFAAPGFSTAISRILISSGASSASVVLISLHLQDASGMTAAEAGLMLLPQAAAIVAGGVLAPVLLRRLRSGTATMLALLLQAVGLGMLALNPAAVLVPLAFIGLGFGVAGTLAATTLFDVTTVDHAGQVGAIQEVGFALGGGLGIAVLGTIAAVVEPGGVVAAIATGAVIVLLAAAAPYLGRGRARAGRNSA